MCIEYMSFVFVTNSLCYIYILQIGDFVIAKSDLNNFECFPIWRIDPGKMMKKYELFTDKGKILHMATCTVSSCWIWCKDEIIHQNHSFLVDLDDESF